MVTNADVKNLKPVYAGQCLLLQSIEFRKHMAETRGGEHYAPLTASVLQTIINLLNASIHNRYPTHSEIQAAALLLWKRYKNANSHTLYPEITVCEYVLSSTEVPPARPWVRIEESVWEAALHKTFEQFEGKNADQVFAIALDYHERGERLIPSHLKQGEPGEKT